METYKERFLAACKNIAVEYLPEYGHHISTITCGICRIYHRSNEANKCKKCPIACLNHQDSTFICVNNLTFPHPSKTDTGVVTYLPNYIVISIARSNFYKLLYRETKELPAKYFRPSSGMKVLREIVKKVDFYVDQHHLNMVPLKLNKCKDYEIT